MSAVRPANPSSCNGPAERVARSADLLASARARAATQRGYESSIFRSDVNKAFSEACEGKDPYEWQVDVAEALWLGLDTAVVAGTGAGKTMPFVMPLLVDKTKKKKVIIISPLNELELDQARRFEKMGLKAAAVNGDVYGKILHNQLVAGEYRVIVTSPEMCLEHALFSSLVKSPEFMRDVLYMVIDEAHCVSQWGDSFRKKFSELSTMRSYIGGRKPFLLTSATLPTFMLTDVFLKLDFSEDTTYFINLGNDRQNITPIVHRLKAAQSSLPILDFLVRDAAPGTTLPRAIVFFNTRDLSFVGYRYLQDCVPSSLAEQIEYLHAGRGRNARRRVMARFREGRINILCATEAAGMGMDIPDITISVQFLAASSLSVWTQRAGRAGRSGQHAFAILLVEPGIFDLKQPRVKATQPKNHAEDSGTMTGQTSKSGSASKKTTAKATKAKKADKSGTGSTSACTATTASRRGTKRTADGVSVAPCQQVEMPLDYTIALTTSDPSPAALAPAPAEDGVLEYKKKAEDGMRRWAGSVDTCRRVVADEYFTNPPRASCGPFPCCDICVKAKHVQGELLTDEEKQVIRMVDLITGKADRGREDADADFDEEGDDALAEAGCDEEAEDDREVQDAALASAQPVPNRRGDHLLKCRARLVRWRTETWFKEYSLCTFDSSTLLPDKVLTTLATQARMKTVADIKRTLPTWPFADDHGGELLALLSNVDLVVEVEKEVQRKMDEEAKAAKDVIKAEKQEQRNAQKRAKTAQARDIWHPETRFDPPVEQVTNATMPLRWQVPVFADNS